MDIVGTISNGKLDKNDARKVDSKHCNIFGIEQ